MDNQPPLARSRRTLFLLPKGAMLKRHIREYSRQYPEIVFRSLDPISKYSEAEKIAQEGFDIVVARGNTADELRKLLSGHLCRCTGYENILRAVKKTMYRRLGLPMPTEPEA